MHSIGKDMEKFRRQLEQGSIQKAYRALLSYMMGLRTHFMNAGSTVSGLYQGYMDMTYFALFPSSLKHRNLKIAIVFDYDAFASAHSTKLLNSTSPRFRLTLALVYLLNLIGVLDCV